MPKDLGNQEENKALPDALDENVVEVGSESLDENIDENNQNEDVKSDEEEAFEEVISETLTEIKEEKKAQEEKKKRLAREEYQNKKAQIKEAKRRKKEEEAKEKQIQFEALAQQRAVEKTKSEDDKVSYDAQRARNKIIRNSKLSKKLRKKNPVYDRYEPEINEGLNEDQVNKRIAQGLNNFKSGGATKTIPQIVFGNIFTFFNLLTFALAAWLISINSIKDLTFLVIVLANLIIGTIQEIKAKKTIDKLSLISAPTCEVIRDGKRIEVGVSEIVLDDLMCLENGRQICSDAIVVEGTIEVNESLLTGEADAIIKHPGDQLYSGSFVVAGQCIARVDKVGSDNYIERLTGQAKQYKKPNSELLNALNTIIKVMGVVVVFAGLGLFLTMKLKNNIAYETCVRKTAGAMVGMIPSGLYLVTSVALAVGVLRLAKKNVLVQEIYCIEMLARVDVLCLDKTGTITDGTMKVKNIIDYNIVNDLTTKDIVSAIINATGDNNLTNKALEEHFGRAKRIKHTELIPFSSQRKYSAVTFEEYGTFVIGAPEFVLKNGFEKVASNVNKSAKEGLRVLVIAHSKEPIRDGAIPQTTLEPVSLILIEDNVRPDAINTIKYFRESGVEVKVISGDNPITVSKVSERAGIKDADKYISLDGLSDKEVVRAASKYTVFGRVSPAQKKLLVKSLQELGHKVAMTGDGVNDILALKEADCSIAVASGSEAARNVSHLVLLDSNFDSMPKVVAEGRRVISNVAKVAKLYLTKTIFSLLLAIEALIAGAYPISTNQLLMIDFLCIGLPSVVLVLEPNNNKAPNNFLWEIIKSALPGAIVILIQSILVFLLASKLDMSSRVQSTMICITATFTCMMVLLETCKPFYTNTRKWLFGGCFTAFVFATLLLPSFFDFSPIISGLEYNSSTEMIYTWETKNVKVSEADYYTIDGYVLNYKSTRLSSTHSVEVSDEGYLIIDNNVYTTQKPILPELSSSLSDLKFVIGAVPTTIEYSPHNYYEVNVKSNGDVYIDVTEYGIHKNVSTGINILPTVTIVNNVYYVNGYSTGVRTTKDKIKKVSLQNNFDVYVDGNKLDYEYHSGNISLSYANGYICLDGNKTDINYDQSLAPTLAIDVKEYTINGEKTGVMYTPEIGTTTAGYYIIDDYITKYKCTTANTTIIQSLYISDVNIKGSTAFLKVDGIITDEVVNYSYAEGGEVSSLPINCCIFLVALCLASHPLITLTHEIVPYSKRQIKKLSEMLNRI